MAHRTDPGSSGRDTRDMAWRLCLRQDAAASADIADRITRMPNYPLRGGLSWDIDGRKASSAVILNRRHRSRLAGRSRSEGGSRDRRMV
jgi:hypothetical protein